MLEETAARVLSRLTEVSIDSGDARATITIVDYSELALDTVTVTIDATAHVLTEGTDWNRGASNAAAATSLAAAIDALTGVSASASAAVVTITAPENITSLAISDAVNMTLVDSSLTTIVDTIKNWEVDKWKDALVEVEVDGVHYYRTIASNTANTLTITTLPAGHPVAPGAHYNIRWSVRVIKISGQTVALQSGTGPILAKISGETVELESGTGPILAKISGETVELESGTGPILAKISGETVVTTISGQTVALQSGTGPILAKVSGETVELESGTGPILAKVSGETVELQSGTGPILAKVSGETVELESGTGPILAKVSGEVMQIILPTEFKTGLIKSVSSNSGGEVLHSGAVKAAQIKSDKDNSGAIIIGGANDRPWYEARCSGLGFVLDPGEAKAEDIDNFDRIYVVAQVSGDQISFAGVN